MVEPDESSDDAETLDTTDDTMVRSTDEELALALALALNQA